MDPHEHLGEGVEVRLLEVDRAAEPGHQQARVAGGGAVLVESEGPRDQEVGRGQLFVHVALPGEQPLGVPAVGLVDHLPEHHLAAVVGGEKQHPRRDSPGQRTHRDDGRAEHVLHPAAGGGGQHQRCRVR